jgi:hypothetical protein
MVGVNAIVAVFTRYGEVWFGGMHRRAQFRPNEVDRTGAYTLAVTRAYDGARARAVCFARKAGSLQTWRCSEDASIFLECERAYILRIACIKWPIQQYMQTLKCSYS